MRFNLIHIPISILATVLSPSIIRTVAVILVTIILTCPSILVTSHTIILDNRRPEERKTCSKVSCSKYLSPEYHDHHSWSSLFRRRKDNFGHKSIHDMDDVDPATRASFTPKEVEDIETLNSELDSTDGSGNDYSKGNDVRMGRRRRGINDEYKRRDRTSLRKVSSYWANDKTNDKFSPFYSKNSSSVSSSLPQVVKKTGKEGNGIKRRRKRSKESKQREEKRRMKCCQRYQEEKGENGEKSRQEEDGDGRNPLEFHHRFGSLPVHHSAPPPHPFLHPHASQLPPHSSMYLPPHSFPPHLIPPHPFVNPLLLPMTYPNHENLLHFNVFGPSISSIGREMNGFDPVNPFPRIDQNGNDELNINRPHFPLSTFQTSPPAEKSKRYPEEGSNEGLSENRSDESVDTVVDEEEEERRKIRHELERKRHFMLMTGQYQPYQPWIHGPVLSVF